LLGTDNIETAVRDLATYEALFAVTRSAQGSVIVHGDTVIEQEAAFVKNVVDTTGAGDAYSAGFLYGWANGRSLTECAKYGTRCATKVIQQVGARVEKGLLDGFQ
jgi:sugar/nucleoside kinase (ribokinase family)